VKIGQRVRQILDMPRNFAILALDCEEC